MDLIASYGDDGDEAPAPQTAPPVKRDVAFVDLSSRLTVSAAPIVTYEVKSQRVVDQTKTHVYTNPTAEELWKPVAGPQAPWTGQNIVPGQRNTLAGFVEDTGMDSYAFDVQLYAFHTLGYAMDPFSNKVVSQAPARTKKRKYEQAATKTADEAAPATAEAGETPAAENAPVLVPPPKKPEQEEEVESEDEEAGETAAPEGGTEPAPAEPATKKARVEFEPRSTFHARERVDYLGRSWIEPPNDLKPGDHDCYAPKRVVHTWAGHSKGVSHIRFSPTYGHLLLSASLDHTVKIWEVYGKRRCMQTYHAHKMPVRDIDFSPDGTQFISCGFDKFTRIFDVETGACLGSFSSGKLPVCCKFYPVDYNQFLIGQKNKKILQYDARTGDIVQEYDRHMDQVNTITFVNQARQFMSTSDDKSIRVWDYGVAAEIKLIADPSMHAIPAATLTPDQQWVLFQSMDNAILVYDAVDTFRANHKKTLRGHNSTGYACKPDMSPDGRFVISGTADGSLVVWDWKTCRIFKRLKEHRSVSIGVTWHPIETSKVASCSWDGTIKLWD